MAMTYGEQYETYGGTICPRCNVAHQAQWQIRERLRSRFKLMQFIAEMATTMHTGPNQIAPAPYIHAGAGQKFMIGLLDTGALTLVAASGGNLNNQAFMQAAQRKGYTICGPRKATLGNHVSIVNRPIPAGQYMSMQAQGASPPGDCAAPRLIERALELFPAPRNIAGWTMSEVFFQPNTARRTRDDLHWVHGLSAHHCATCANLVPLLLCPVP
jgi:hypothetical protein